MHRKTALMSFLYQSLNLIAVEMNHKYRFRRFQMYSFHCKKSKVKYGGENKKETDYVNVFRIK